MLKLIIEDDEGHKTTVPFVREEITVGREEGNTIRLTERNVSRRHARFFRQEGQVFVEDLKSYNGIKVNGDRIAGQTPLKEGDLVQIGDYDLAVQSAESSQSMDAGVTAATPMPEDEDEIERDPSKPAMPVNKRDATSMVRFDGPLPNLGPAMVEEGEAVNPNDAPRLVVVSTEMAGREFACIRTVITIGRGDECDVSLDHRSLSRLHAKLRREADGSGWKVVDLGSSNRVQVNGEDYAETLLTNGDIIGLGHVKLRFVAPGEEFTWVPEGGARSSAKGGGSGVGIILGVALFVVVTAGAGWFFFLRPQTGAKGGGEAASAGKAPGNEPAPPAGTAEPKAAPSTAGEGAPREAVPAAKPAEPAPEKAEEPPPAAPPTTAAKEPEPAPVALKPEPKPEPVAAPKPEPVVEAPPAPVVAKPAPKPEPVAAPKPEPVEEPVKLAAVAQKPAAPAPELGLAQPVVFSRDADGQKALAMLGEYARKKDWAAAMGVLAGDSVERENISPATLKARLAFGSQYAKQLAAVGWTAEREEDYYLQASFHLARHQIKHGHPQEAQALLLPLQRMLGNKKGTNLPLKANIEAHLGDAYDAAGQPKIALSWYQTALKTDPSGRHGRDPLTDFIPDYAAQHGLTP